MKNQEKAVNYTNVINSEYFWQYAKDSEFYGVIKHILESYTEEDRSKGQEMFEELVNAIENMKHSERTFKKLWFDKNLDKENGTI